MSDRTAILMCITFAVIAVCIVYGTVRVIQKQYVEGGERFMRLIDADALIDAVMAEGAELETELIFFQTQSVIDLIEEQPTVAGDPPGK